MAKISYKLYGIVNLFNRVPDFVLPVFERNGNYYFGFNNDTPKYTHFEIIEHGDTINKIRALNNIPGKVLVSVKPACCIGDQYLYAMEDKPNAIYIAPIDKMSKYLDGYRTNDDNFQDAINTVKSEIVKVKKRK